MSKLSILESTNYSIKYIIIICTSNNIINITKNKRTKQTFTYNTNFKIQTLPTLRRPDVELNEK